MIAVAFYMRISRSDEEEESSSISTQRILLTRYAKQEFRGEKIKITEYVDDGCSGTGTERPGWKLLMKHCAAGKVDCVMVKDLSRLSRSYIEIGWWIEQIVPRLNIRLIVAASGYDSRKQQARDGLAMQFQYLLNDFYSKDISAKVKASNQARQRMGTYQAGVPPFGYRRGEDATLQVVEPEAEVIREIFSRTGQGESSGQIARDLNKRQVPTPGGWKLAREHRELSGVRYLWDSSMVCRILRNPCYMGIQVYGKSAVLMTGGRTYPIEREKWQYQEGHHMPIVSRETFEQAQARRRKQREGKREKLHPLTGKLVCGVCGRTLKYVAGTQPYYICPKQYLTEEGACIPPVSVRMAEQIIFKVMQIELYCFRQTMATYKNKEEPGKKKRKLQANQGEKIRKEKMRLYEKYCLGEISDLQYHMWKKNLDQEKQEESEAESFAEERERTMTEKSEKIPIEAAEYLIGRAVVTGKNQMILQWNYTNPWKMTILKHKRELCGEMIPISMAKK